LAVFPGLFGLAGVGDPARQHPGEGRAVGVRALVLEDRLELGDRELAQAGPQLREGELVVAGQPGRAVVPAGAGPGSLALGLLVDLGRARLWLGVVFVGSFRGVFLGVVLAVGVVFGERAFLFGPRIAQFRFEFGR
jgi:hypothetical protein